ncbi:MAG: glucosaminidase domain-containing protein [Thalassobaculaceae bacterium]
MGSADRSSGGRRSGPKARIVLIAGLLLIGAFQVSAFTVGPPRWSMPPRAEAPAVRVVTPAPMPDGGRAFTVASADTLLRLYERSSFDLAAVRAGDQDVPRLYLTTLPTGFDRLEQVGPRKRAFLRVVLPLVLRVNVEIGIVRTRVAALVERIEAGETLRATDRRWLISVARRYGVIDAEAAQDGQTLDERLLDDRARAELLRRIDAVPVPLALAQTIVESGWGRSRFAMEGNALYGQWTWDKSQGIAPAGAPDAAHAVRAFDSLIHSVRGYMHNLNTHPAYAGFRAARADGAGSAALARTLTRYSERGAVYGEELVEIMAQNDLEAFAGARLGATEIRRGGAWQSLEPLPDS